MRFLPIVARELRVAARRPGAYRARTSAACLAVGGLLVAWFAGQFTRVDGSTLLTGLSVIAFAYCLFAGTRATADCLSSEKREGTLGLLFLTDLKGYDIVLGKLVSCSLTAFYGLLAIVPVLSLAVVWGGVSPTEIMLMALLFLNTLWFSMAAGIFASSLSRNDRRAMFATGCVVLGLAGAPFVLAISRAIWLVYRGTPPNSLWDFSDILTPSPIYAFQIVHLASFSPTMRRAFSESLWMTHGLGWLLLVLTGWILPWVSRDRPAGRRGLRWRALQNRWSFGNPAQRRVFRARLLDRNAFYWLAARERIKASYAWFLVFAIPGIWGLTGLRLGSFVFEWDVSFWMLFLLFVVFKLWFVSEVCTRLAEDRANGAFELLLSSPLDVNDIARGMSLALWRQFGKPSLVLFALTLLALSSALQGGHYYLTDGELKLLFLGLLVMFVADLLALQWTGMWQAVIQNRINTAILATALRVLLFPTVVLVALSYIIWMLVQVFSPSNIREVPFSWTIELWLALGLITDLVYGVLSRWQFLRRFREVATQRFAAPKLKRNSFGPLLEAAHALFRKRPLIQAPNSPRLWRRPFVLVSILLGCLLLPFGWWRYSRSSNVQRQLNAIRAAGEPVTVAELVQWLPQAAPAQNAGLLLYRAAPTLTLPARLPGAKRPLAFLSVSEFRQFDWIASTNPPSPELVLTVSNVVAQNRPALDLVHQAALKPQSRYPFDWSGGQIHVTSHLQLARLRSAIPLLQLEAWLHLTQQHPDAAIQSAWALLGLARAFRQEPFIIAQEQRRLALSAAVGILEGTLKQVVVPPSQLQPLGDALLEAASSTGPALSQTLVAERCLTVDALTGGRNSAQRWGVANGWEAMAAGLLEVIGQISGLTDGYTLEYLSQVRPWIQELKEADGGNRGHPAHDPLSENRSRPGGKRFHAIHEYWRMVWNQHQETSVHLRVAATALAIERYRAGHDGQLPDNLQELSPSYLAQVPSDPYDSNLLRYRRLEKGFLVYSVGPDRKDNGGAESSQSQRRKEATEFDLSFMVAR